MDVEMACVVETGMPNFAATTSTVAATATTTLRVGSYVFVNDYRHPALLAREIATLDQLSDGRVELGLGAGNWQINCAISRRA